MIRFQWVQCGVLSWEGTFSKSTTLKTLKRKKGGVEEDNTNPLICFAVTGFACLPKHLH